VADEFGLADAVATSLPAVKKLFRYPDTERQLLKSEWFNELSAKASNRWRQKWKGGDASMHNIKSGSVWLQPDGGRWSKFLRFYRAYFNQESYAWVQHSLHLNLSFEFVASIFSDPDKGPFHELCLQFSEGG